jgi:hypothetical protein
MSLTWGQQLVMSGLLLCFKKGNFVFSKKLPTGMWLAVRAWLTEHQAKGLLYNGCQIGGLDSKKDEAITKERDKNQTTTCNEAGS